MNHPTTVASGMLALASLGVTVKYQMDHKRAMDNGEEDTKLMKKKRMATVFAIATLLFAGVLVYQLIKAKPAGSFLPSSSMSHTESEAEFARRVSAATARLREKMKDSATHTPLTAPSASATTSDLAAMASAEISSFIANNV